MSFLDAVHFRMLSLAAKWNVLQLKYCKTLVAHEQSVALHIAEYARAEEIDSLER